MKNNMKNLLTFNLVLLLAISLHAQQRVFPIVKNYGGIFEIPNAVEKPDSSLNYNIVVEVFSGSEKPAELNYALNNVARLINLHAIGGVPKEKIKVVVAIHGEAAYTIMQNDQYKAKYKTDNPNLALYKALDEAGVQLFVCGQSLIARQIDSKKLIPEIKIATSMLTVVSTHQLKGYAFFKF
jgi:intracellular sulfur oxidation DsrE/DsrF family protein